MKKYWKLKGHWNKEESQKCFLDSFFIRLLYFRDNLCLHLVAFAKFCILCPEKSSFLLKARALFNIFCMFLNKYFIYISYTYASKSNRCLMQKLLALIFYISVPLSNKVGLFNYKHAILTQE